MNPDSTSRTPLARRSPLLCLWLAAFGLMLLAAPAYAQSFRSSVTYPTTTYPNSIAVADYDHDGDLDFAVPHFGGYVVIMMGDGHGRFTRAGTFDAGQNSGTRASVATDLNGDGNVDLVISNQEGASVTVLIGNGAGAFARGVKYPAGLLAYFLSTADFNEDGRPDIAVANSGSGTISVLLGDGTGKLGVQVQYPVGDTPRSVIPADFNGDGHVDLVAANYVGNTVSLLLGDGAGHFTTVTTKPTAGGPYLLAAGDLNSDGAMDLVVPNFDVGSVSVLFGNGAGGLTDGPTIATGASPRHASIADVNGDGRKDLVVSNRDASTMSVLLGDGAGHFSAPRAFGVGSGPFSTQIRDFDGDGRLDIAVVERDAFTISVMLGEGTGEFPAPLSLPVGGSPRAIAAADFDGDGKPDVAVANNYTNNVTVLLGDGHGGARSATNFAAGRGPYAIAAADLNGDTLPDLAVANASNNNVSVLLGDGAGGFAAQRFFTVAGNPRSVAVADFTGDGRPDIVATNYGNASVALLRNLGSGTFATPVQTAVGANPSAVIALDANGDHLADIAVTNTGSNTMMVLLGNGAGGFAAPRSFATGVSPAALTSADLDGDSYPDLAVANFAAASVTVFHGDGAGNFVTASTVPVGAGPLDVAAADFDADGHVDIATASADANKVSVARGTAAGSFAAAVPFGGGLYARALAVADFTADGKPDIAVANTTGNDVWILVNTEGVANVSITVDDGVALTQPGLELTYQVVVSNHGPAGVAAASVAVTVPASLTNVTWTCGGSSAASCAASGVGGILDSVSLPDHGSVTYVLHGTVAPDAAGTLTVTAAVSVSSPGTDTDAADNSAADSDSLGVNHVPQAQPQSVDATEDVASSLTLVATDQDGDQLVWSIVTLPSHGSLSGTAPALTYTPAPNFSGADTFTFKVNDGFANSAIAEVTIAVAPVNDVPTAAPQSVTLAQGGTIGIVLSGSDDEGEALTFAVVQSVAHGTLSGSGANLTYTPSAGYSGSDAFTFTAADPGATSQPATVSITVTPVNSAPAVASPIADVSVTDQSTSTSLNLAATFTDADLPYGDSLSLAVVGNSNPALVAPSFSGATLTMGLTAGASGSATLTVRATDSHGLFAEDSFVVTVSRPALSVSISDVVVTEVNSGVRAAVFTVSLSAPAPAAITVTYRTGDGTAVEGSDYTAVTSGTLTFAAGTSSRTLTINTTGDVIDEEDENFHVLLSGASGAAIADGDGLGTIIDNDQSALSVNDVTLTEGHSGTVTATFNVSMNVPNSRIVTVDYGTVNVTALAGADYQAVLDRLTFAPGVTLQTVSVQVIGDVLDEANESFSMGLGNPINATIARSKGNGVIVDDDDPPSVSIDDLSLPELHATTTATMTLTLSASSGQTVRVQFTTANGTAIAGSDYVTRSGEIQFAPGVVTRTIPITVLGDRIAEPTETFTVHVTSATAATIARPQATVTILDDDGS